MTYDLRRLRLYGLIERIEGSHRYQLTHTVLMATQFYTRLYARAVRPTFSFEIDNAINTEPRSTIAKLDRVIGELLQEVQLAA